MVETSLKLMLRLEATCRGGLRVVSCQAEKQPERKDSLRKPLPPNLRADDVMTRFSFSHFR